MASPSLERERNNGGIRKFFSQSTLLQQQRNVDMMPYRNNDLKETFVADIKVKTLIKTFYCLIATLIRCN